MKVPGIATPLSMISYSGKVAESFYNICKSIHKLSKANGKWDAHECAHELLINSEKLALNTINLILAISILTPVLAVEIIPILAIPAAVLTVHLAYPMIKEKFFGKTTQPGLGQFNHSTLFRESAIQPPQTSDTAYTDKDTKEAFEQFSEPAEHSYAVRPGLSG